MTALAPTTRHEAWRTLGTPLLTKDSAESALREGGLSNWNVRKVPSMAEVLGDDGVARYLDHPGRNKIIYDRPGGGVGVLGDVGRSFHILQIEDQIRFLDVFRQEAGATFETAGHARGGAWVFITMRVPNALLVGGADPVDMFVTSINSFDGSLSHTLIGTLNRIACMNQLAAARRNARAGRDHTNMLKVRHTVGAYKTLEQESRKLLDELFDYADDFKVTAERLAATPLSYDRFDEIITEAYGPTRDAGQAAVTRTENKLDEMRSLFSEAGTQAEIRDTAWAGYNALTEWFDHYRPVRGDDHEASRAMAAIFDDRFKARALDLMLTA